MIKVIARLINESNLLGRLIRSIFYRYSLGSNYLRYLIGAVERPHYAYLLVLAAENALRFGVKEVGVIEFGVGGGGGLLCMENYSEWIEKKYKVKFRFLGFDLGSGMPPNRSIYDLPYMWTEGQFKLNYEQVILKLKKTEIILGQISETIEKIEDKNFPLIGAISFDVDYYSSTLDALQIFKIDSNRFLPRIPLYFDDCIGTEIEMHIDHIGERRAIKEFNDSVNDVKIGQAYYLSTESSTRRWQHKIWYAHLFTNTKYSDKVKLVKNSNS